MIAIIIAARTADSRKKRGRDSDVAASESQISNLKSHQWPAGTAPPAARLSSASISFISADSRLLCQTAQEIVARQSTATTSPTHGLASACNGPSRTRL